jgi:hypothetical protein
MSDQPITLAVLAQFHREIFLPDFERVVRESEFRLRNEMQTSHDEIVDGLDKLVTRPGKVDHV